MTDFGKPWTFLHITIKGFIILINCKAVSTPHWEHPGWFNNQNFEGKLRDVFFLSSAQTYYKHEAFSKKGAKCIFSSFFPTPPLSTAFDTCRLGQVGWGWPPLGAGLSAFWAGWEFTVTPVTGLVCGAFWGSPRCCPLLLKFPRDRQHIPLRFFTPSLCSLRASLTPCCRGLWITTQAS